MKGLFITFEGGEGAGKTTLIEGIKQNVSSSFEVVQTREPGGTKLGEKIRELLLVPQDVSVASRAELALFLASRAQNIQECILPALKAGKMVLCDRFNDSSYAYQGIGRDLGLEEVQRVANFFCQDLVPDLTFYLDLDPNVGFKRVNSRSLDRIESEKITFHQKVREAYHLLAKQEPNRLHILNANQSPEDVLSAAMQHINKHLKTHKS